MESPLILSEYEERRIEVTLKEKLRIENELTLYLDHKFENVPHTQSGLYSGTIIAKYYVGLIVVSDQFHIIITPKIYFADFIVMLQYVDEKRVKIWKNLAHEIETTKNFVDVFLRMFLTDVYELLIKNRRHGYQKEICLDLMLKGKILVEKSLRQLHRIPPVIVSQTHEFTADTIENQIILWTLNYIRPLISVDLLYKYRTVLAILDQVTLRPIQISEIDRIHYSRLSQCYRPIHDFCRLLLQDFSLDFKKGKEKFYSFVINTWNVYEKFLFAIFSKFQQKYHVDPYKLEDLNEDVDWDNKKGSEKRPDLIFSDSLTKKSWLIIDAKYKLNPTGNDENQIFRYLANRELRIGFLIYPQKGTASQNRIFTDLDRNVNLLYLIHYIDLTQIKNPDYIQNFVSNIIALTEDAYNTHFECTYLQHKYHLSI